MDLFGLKRKARERDFNKEVSLAVQSALERYGTATAGHLKSYFELAEISRFKINPDFARQNLEQQAGFSAEVKNVARINADNIIDGKPTRVARTDNVGSVNHPQYDRVNVDARGNPILDSSGNFTGGTQQKNFYKVRNYDKLLFKEYEHYAGAKIDLPCDQFDEIMARWDSKIANFRKQAEYLRKNGNPEKAAEIDGQIERIKDVKSRARPSRVSTEDAMEARVAPGVSVAKDVLRVSHRAGVESSKCGAAIGGGLSVCQNLAAVANGEKDFESAAVDIARDTGKAAAVSYAMGAGSAALGGALKATGNEVCKNLAKGNAPAAVLQTGAMLAKNSLKLISGEIGVDEFIMAIGKDGSNLAASFTGSNLGAVVGTCIAPGVGTIVGGVVGGVIASFLNGAMYDELLKTARDNKLSDEKRVYVREICTQLKRNEVEYQDQVNACFDAFFTKKETELRESFGVISAAVSNETSVDDGLKKLAKSFGTNVAFKSNEELEDFLLSGETLQL